MSETIHCVDCAAEIVKRSRTHKRCADCSKERAPELKREAMARWYKKHRKGNREWQMENSRRAKRWRKNNSDWIRQYDQERRPAR